MRVYVSARVRARVCLCTCFIILLHLGDGRKPFSAAAVCLRSPPSWKVWSIDPLMEDHFLTGPEDPKHPLGVHAARMTCVNGLSQDFMIPESSPASAPKQSPAGSSGGSGGSGGGSSSSASEVGVVSVGSEGDEAAAAAAAAEPELVQPTLSIILAVHSHCPLPEFVERVPRPRLVVSLPYVVCMRAKSRARAPCLCLPPSSLHVYMSFFLPQTHACARTRIRTYGS